MPAPTLAVAGILLLVVWPGAAAGQPRQPPGARTVDCLATYRLAADQYRAGDIDKAAATLQRVDGEQLKIVVDWLKFMRGVPASSQRLTTPPQSLFVWERRTLLSAGMLHVDLAIAAYLTQRHTDFFFQTDLAAQLFAIADQPRAGTAEPAGTAARRSAVAIGTKLLGDGALGLAEPYLSGAIQRFPDEPPLLLAFATLLETKTSQLVQLVFVFDDPMVFGRARTSRDARLKDAEKAFERVLAVDPACVEARVRLAHVHVLQHDDARAASLLTDALAAHPPPEWTYLAHLMLGGTRERSGQFAAAMQMYADAVTIRPQGQSAYIALSHAMYASGDPASAAAALDRLFALHLTPISQDPWWGYPFGDWTVADPMLRALRDEARR